MGMEEEIREKAVREVVDNVTTELTSRSYNASALGDKVQDKIAARVAEAYLEQHELELLKAVDVDTVVRLATLKLIAKIADRFDR